MDNFSVLIVISVIPIFILLFLLLQLFFYLRFLKLLEKLSTEIIVQIAEDAQHSQPCSTNHDDPTNHEIDLLRVSLCGEQGSVETDAKKTSSPVSSLNRNQRNKTVSESDDQESNTDAKDFSKPVSQRLNINNDSTSEANDQESNTDAKDFSRSVSQRLNRNNDSTTEADDQESNTDAKDFSRPVFQRSDRNDSTTEADEQGINTETKGSSCPVFQTLDNNHRHDTTTEADDQESNTDARQSFSPVLKSLGSDRGDSTTEVNKPESNTETKKSSSPVSQSLDRNSRNKTVSKSDEQESNTDAKQFSSPVSQSLGRNPRGDSTTEAGKQASNTQAKESTDPMSPSLGRNQSNSTATANAPSSDLAFVINRLSDLGKMCLVVDENSPSELSVQLIPSRHDRERHNWWFRDDNRDRPSYTTESSEHSMRDRDSTITDSQERDMQDVPNPTSDDSEHNMRDTSSSISDSSERICGCFLGPNLSKTDMVINSGFQFSDEENTNADTAATAPQDCANTAIDLDENTTVNANEDQSAADVHSPDVNIDHPDYDLADNHPENVHTYNNYTDVHTYTHIEHVHIHNRSENDRTENHTENDHTENHTENDHTENHLENGHTENHPENDHTENRPENDHTETRPENDHTETRPENDHTGNHPENDHTENRPENFHTDNHPVNYHTENRPENVHNCTHIANVHTFNHIENVHTFNYTENFHTPNHPENVHTDNHTGVYNFIPTNPPANVENAVNVADMQNAFTNLTVHLENQHASSQLGNVVVGDTCTCTDVVEMNRPLYDAPRFTPSTLWVPSTNPDTDASEDSESSDGSEQASGNGPVSVHDNDENGTSNNSEDNYCQCQCQCNNEENAPEHDNIENSPVQDTEENSPHVENTPNRDMEENASGDIENAPNHEEENARHPDEHAQDHDMDENAADQDNIEERASEHQSVSQPPDNEQQVMLNQDVVDQGEGDSSSVSGDGGEVLHEAGHWVVSLLGQRFGHALGGHQLANPLNTLYANNRGLSFRARCPTTRAALSPPSLSQIATQRLYGIPRLNQFAPDCFRFPSPPTLPRVPPTLPPPYHSLPPRLQPTQQADCLPPAYSLVDPLVSRTEASAVNRSRAAAAPPSSLPSAQTSTGSSTSQTEAADSSAPLPVPPHVQSLAGSLMRRMQVPPSSVPSSFFLPPHPFSTPDVSAVARRSRESVNQLSALLDAGCTTGNAHVMNHTQNDNNVIVVARRNVGRHRGSNRRPPRSGRGWGIPPGSMFSGRQNVLSNDNPQLQSNKTFSDQSTQTTDDPALEPNAKRQCRHNVSPHVSSSETMDEAGEESRRQASRVSVERVQEVVGCGNRTVTPLRTASSGTVSALRACTSSCSSDQGNNATDQESRPENRGESSTGQDSGPDVHEIFSTGRGSKPEVCGEISTGQDRRPDICEEISTGLDSRPELREEMPADQDSGSSPPGEGESGARALRKEQNSGSQQVFPLPLLHGPVLGSTIEEHQANLRRMFGRQAFTPSVNCSLPDTERDGDDDGDNGDDDGDNGDDKDLDTR